MIERKFILSSLAVLSNAILVSRNLPMDGSVEIVFRSVQKSRSEFQNARLWAACMADISEQAWVNGKQFSNKVWHEFFKRKYLPEGNEEDFAKLVKNPEKYQKWSFLPNGEMHLVGSTTQLTKLGMTIYMTKVEAYSAGELGVRFTTRRE